MYALLFLLALGLATGLAGCGGGQEAQQPQEEAPQEQPPAEQPPAEQPPAEQPPAEQPPAEEDLVVQGEQLAQSQGCMGCHTTDGSPGVGPTWKGLFGSEVKLADGATVTVDEAYLKESIVDPDAKVVEGFAKGVMPAYGQLSDEEIRALIAYIKSLADSESE